MMNDSTQRCGVIHYIAAVTAEPVTAAHGPGDDGDSGYDWQAREMLPSRARDGNCSKAGPMPVDVPAYAPANARIEGLISSS